MDALELCDMQKGTVLYFWPYKFLRRFGHDKVMFSFEAGRRCSSGEGCFEFATRQGAEIIQAVEAAIQAHKDAEASGCSSGGGGGPGPFPGMSLLGSPSSQAKADEEGPQQPGDRPAQAPDRGLPSRPASGKSPSLESGWAGKLAQGKRVLPSSSSISCLLPSPTRGPSQEQPEAPLARQDTQYGPGLLDRAGKMVVPQVRVVPELEYSEPLDSLSRAAGGLHCLGGSPEEEEEGPWPSGAYGRIDDLGRGPAQRKPEHIYDDPEVLVHLVYDEPQEIKGDAWKLQAMAEDPVGHEYPYNPCLDDYAVPKVAASAMAQLPTQGKSGLLRETGYDRMVLSLKKMMTQK